MTTQQIEYTIEGEGRKMAFTTARINAAIDTALATSTHVQLHTGAPGTSGTANVASGVTRAALTKGPAGSPTDRQSTSTASWVIPGAGGPYTHFSLWTAVSGGTFTGDGSLTPQETFAGSGTLALTMTVTGS